MLFDRAGVTQAAFSGQNTKLLFHVLREPTVHGSPQPVTPGETLFSSAKLAQAVSGEGKLFLKVLLPAQHNIRKVGGRRRKSFWVFDANYDWHETANDAQPRPTNEFEDKPYGEWRLEVEPADTALEHNFLTVLFPTSKSTMAMPPTALVTAGADMSGAHIADPQLRRVVLFSTAPDSSPPVGTISYGYPEGPRTLNLLFDLTPGTHYRIETTVSGNRRSVKLPPGCRWEPHGE